MMIQSKTGFIARSLFFGKQNWLDAGKLAGSESRRDNLAFGTIESYLIYRLTGGQIIYRCNKCQSDHADGTGKADDWDDSLLEMFGIPRKALPCHHRLRR